jgi:uncharacterized SAM-binding protein YcdF (DUF218 family)
VIGAIRGAALFLAGFAATSAAVALHTTGADDNLWWLDLRVAPPGIAAAFFALIAIVLLAFAIWPRQRSPWRSISIVCLSLVSLVALANAAVFYSLLLRGVIASKFPVPFSAFVATLLIAALFVLLRQPAGIFPHKPLRLLASFFFAMAAFPVLQIIAFGSTDYRRPGDVIVVFGARAYSDGTASQPLADRVRTGCELYHQAVAPRLLFSGGPADGSVDEPHAMQRLATSLGVPAPAITLDPAGLNTEATVRNTATLFGPHVRVIAVSHFYHLPRIKLAFEKYGIAVETVPSHLTTPWHLIYNIPREAVAFWAYYLRRL